MSRSQAEILRYAIQLALIYSINQKFEKLPIKSIIIDDPDPKFIEPLKKLLEEKFEKENRFQIIILTNIAENHSWPIKEFIPFDNNFKINDPKFNLTLEKFMGEN